MQYSKLLSSGVVHPSLPLCFSGKGVYGVVSFHFFDDCAYVIATWSLCLSLGGTI